MSDITQNLKLFKYNTLTDGKEVFSIDKAINENLDKIDASTLNHSLTTNCLTEIPQRIKLEKSRFHYNIKNRLSCYCSLWNNRSNKTISYRF